MCNGNMETRPQENIQFQIEALGIADKQGFCDYRLVVSIKNDNSGRRNC